MIAAYAFFWGALAGFLEGQTYKFFVGKSKLPPAWTIIFCLFAVPILSIGMWTELKYTWWWPPIIVLTCEALTIVAAAFHQKIIETIIEPCPPLAYMRNKLIRLSAALNESNSEYIRWKRPGRIILERILISSVMLPVSMLSLALFMNLMGAEEKISEQAAYQTIFSMPGYMITSVTIVRQRWKEKARRR